MWQQLYLFQTIIVFTALLVCTFAASPYQPAPAYGKVPAYADAPAVYQYEYAVVDEYSGVNFGQNEHRDGYSTTGQYTVLLPDGRTQIVTYSTADAYSGNIADVQYKGEAHYAPYKPAPKAPAYKPAPYKPVPAYHA